MHLINFLCMSFSVNFSSCDLECILDTAILLLLILVILSHKLINKTWKFTDSSISLLLLWTIQKRLNTWTPNTLFNLFHNSVQELSSEPPFLQNKLDTVLLYTFFIFSFIVDMKFVSQFFLSEEKKCCLFKYIL